MRDPDSRSTFEFTLDDKHYSITLSNDLIARYGAGDPEAVVEVETKLIRAVSAADEELPHKS